MGVVVDGLRFSAFSVQAELGNIPILINTSSVRRCIRTLFERLIKSSDSKINYQVVNYWIRK